MRVPRLGRKAAGYAPARLVTRALFTASALCAASLARAGEAEEAKTTERVRALAEQLTAKDPDARRFAAYALLRLGPAAAEAGPALVRALEDRDCKLRLAAAEALGKLGLPADEVVPPLVRALNDRNERVAHHARYALRGYEPDSVAELLTALGGSDKRWSRRAARVLMEIGPAAVPGLAGALKGEDTELRRRAAEVLASIGHEAGGAASALVEALKDEDIELRRNAAGALHWIGAAGRSDVRDMPGVTQVFISALKARDRHVRSGAACALGEMGPAAAEAVPALVRASRKEDDDDAIVSALARIDKAAGEKVRRALKRRPCRVAAETVYSTEATPLGPRIGLGLGVGPFWHGRRFLEVEAEILEDSSVPCFRARGPVPIFPLVVPDALELLLCIDLEVGRNLRLEQERAWSASLGVWAEGRYGALDVGYKKVEYTNADTFRGLRFTPPELRVERALAGGRRLGPALVAGGGADICIGGSDGFAFQSDMEGWVELRYTRPGEKTWLRAAVRAGVEAAWDSGNETFESDPYVRAGVSLAF